MNNHHSLSSNWMSSHKWYLEVLGALILSKVWAAGYLVAALLIVAGLFCFPLWRDVVCFTAASLAVLLVWRIVRTLNTIYCLRKEESRITWSQIALLVSFGCWLLVVIKILNINKESPSYIIISVIGGVLGWIFQDTIKSVVAFFYLRANNLLKIGDWIEVSSHGIDGFVKGISLTTVIIENWDTTTSAFPTYILHSEHFKNSQNMIEGKTHGRRMLKTFIIDTGWIHPMSEEEIERLKTIEDHGKDMKHFIEWFVSRRSSQQRCHFLNIELYRQYVYHWLMQHPHVSHEPRLIVRWLEQVPEGMPLQVYVFITDSNLAAFEWQQSNIIEHLIEALAWFNLQLYQRTSGYDVTHRDVNMTDQIANSQRKTKENGEIQ